MQYKMILAVCRGGGLANTKKNAMPWPHIKEEMGYFYSNTIGTTCPSQKNAVVMGRKTWDSLPPNKRPLPWRDNLVMTQSHAAAAATAAGHDAGVAFFQDIDSLDAYCREKCYETVWIIGGAKIYNLFLEAKVVDYIYLTYIDADFEYDVCMKFLKEFGKPLLGHDTYPNAPDICSSVIIPLTILPRSKKDGRIMQYNLISSRKQTVQLPGFDAPLTMYYTRYHATEEQMQVQEQEPQPLTQPLTHT
jgi:dihydrofolate reductase